MQRPLPTVYVIDDDASVLRAMGRLLRSVGMQPELFSSPGEFLRIAEPVPGACLLADIRLEGSSGLDLPPLLNARHWQLPVIFLTAQDSDEIRTAAKRAGASAMFCKPVDDRALIDAIEWAVGNGG